MGAAIQIADERLQRGGAVVVVRIGVFGGRLPGVARAAHDARLILGEQRLDAPQRVALGMGADARDGGAVQRFHRAALPDKARAHHEIPQRIAHIGQLQRTGQMALRK